MNSAPAMSPGWTTDQETARLSRLLLEPQSGESHRRGHARSHARSQDLAAAASSSLDRLLTRVFFPTRSGRFKARFQVSVKELTPVESASAKPDPAGLGCHSDPAAFCNRVGSWNKARASTAPSPAPPGQAQPLRVTPREQEQRRAELLAHPPSKMRQSLFSQCHLTANRCKPRRACPRWKQLMDVPAQGAR